MLTPRLILCAAVAAASLPAQEFVGPVRDPATGHLYLLSPPMNGVAAADLYAVALGGSLARIGGPAENAFLQQAFGAHLAALQAYVGYSDAQTEGSWTDFSGVPAPYVNWSAGEPNNLGVPGEDYAAFLPSGAWNDVNGDVTLRAIVEADAFLAGYSTTPVFVETFANNAAGWTLGPSWQIGSAVAFGTSEGDPGVDAAGVAGGGLAGVVIGGNYSGADAAATYLTSPVVPLFPGQSYQLAFKRWLTTDYPNYVVNAVDLFDGVTWHSVWLQSQQTFLTATAWSEQTIDVTAFANANFQFRFGYEVNSGAFPRGGWSVDDVRVLRRDPVCTLAVTYPAGPGSLALRNGRCDGSVVAYTFVTANTAGVPGGWFFGISPSWHEVDSQLSAGVAPFFQVLDPSGGSLFTIPGGLPPGFSFAAVTVGLNAFLTPAEVSPPVVATTL
jgi:hypothetical protein